jgi:hypothetical protein
MKNMNKLKTCYLPAFMMAALLGYGSPTIAADDPPASTPDFVVTFPAGLACGFELQVEGWEGNQHFREFKDKKGIVRTLSAGTGSALRYTNVTNGKTFSSKSNGAVAHQTFNLDGSSTQKFTGHNLVILFPSDTPPGPSTTLYAGRVIISIDSNDNFTVQQESGNKTNICAAVQ